MLFGQETKGGLVGGGGYWHGADSSMKAPLEEMNKYKTFLD